MDKSNETLRNNNHKESYRSTGNVAKMWIFSILGIIYFAIPFKVNGETEMWVSFLE